MSVLVDSEIKNLSTSPDSLIAPFEFSLLQGASYDLRLGEQIAQNGKIEILELKSPTLKIVPGEFVILSTHEKLNIPLNIIGHNGIMSKWAKRGLVSLFSPQIDPGFKGMLIVPVFNAGDSDVSISLHEPIFTVEFVKTTISASKGWSESHGEQNTIKELASPIINRPSLSDISSIKEELKQSNLKILELQHSQDILRNSFDNLYKKNSLSIAKIAIVVTLLCTGASISSSYIFSQPNPAGNVSTQNRSTK
jgi:deoxycytidine triphosphate deaminase